MPQPRETASDLRPASQPAAQPGGPQWVSAGSLEALAAAGRRLLRHEGRQVALFHSRDEGGERVLACANACPHEGYPLSEGTLEGCVLTCNWHNWKFDLASGATLEGGDRVRTYPVALRDGEVWVDLAPEPAALRRERALRGLAQAFERFERDRIAREAARLEAAGADPLDALRWAVAETHDRFEYGATHALGAAADWLALREREARDPAERLAALTEVLVHLADDSLREPRYPFPEGTATWDPENGPAAFLAAVEAQDAAAAVPLLRGALAAGLGPADLRPLFARAALAHYADFGHALIYSDKLTALAARLGPESHAPLLLALTRALLHARREDLIPEFRGYAPALAAWDAAAPEAQEPAAPEDFAGLDLRRVLARCLRSAGRPRELFRALLGAAALQLLRFDAALGARSDGPVSANVSWLDFTHALTFADALRVLAEEEEAGPGEAAGSPLGPALGSPPGSSLWPAGLLQLACFLGRSTRYLERGLGNEAALAPWRVADPPAFLAQARRGLFDHGQAEPIVSAHLAKTVTAVEALIAADPDSPAAPLLAAALNRFLASPFKRRHLLRDARQALARVAEEG